MRSMRHRVRFSLRTLLVVVTVIAVVLGFLTMRDTVTLDTPVQFRETVEPQTAVFFVSQGWCGGNREAALGADHRILCCAGSPIWLDSDAKEEIRLRARDEQSRAQHREGKGSVRRIIVKARIHLENRSGMFPGGRMRDYYALIVDKLIDVAVEGKPDLYEQMRRAREGR